MNRIKIRRRRLTRRRRLSLPILWAAGSLPLAFFPAFAADDARAAAGAAIYKLRCSPCHGIELHNTSGGWSFDLRRLRADEHDRFIDSVTTGKDNMPSWYGILDREEMESIWAYIRATYDKDHGSSK